MWVMVFKQICLHGFRKSSVFRAVLSGLRLVALGASNIRRFEDFLQAAHRVSHGLIGL